MGKLNLEFQENAHFQRRSFALLEKIRNTKEAEKISIQKMGKLDLVFQENAHFGRTFWGVIFRAFRENLEYKSGRKNFDKKIRKLNLEFQENAHLKRGSRGIQKGSRGVVLAVMKTCHF